MAQDLVREEHPLSETPWMVVIPYLGQLVNWCKKEEDRTDPLDEHAQIY